MQQQTLVFDKFTSSAAENSAQTTPLIPPTDVRLPLPPLVRPDRQLTYGGAPPCQWPQPEHNHGMITVDRYHSDIDGPPHRFVIQRGDTVEVVCSPDRSEIGEVTGVNLERQQVQVALRDGERGTWFAKERIYPAPEIELQLPAVTTVPPHRPSNYSLAEFNTFRRNMADGSLTFEDFREHFARLVTAKDRLLEHFQTYFCAQELAAIAQRIGCPDAERNEQNANAVAIYRQMLLSFVLDWMPRNEKMILPEESIVARVEAYPRREFEQAQQRIVSGRRALRLRTLADFRTFLEERCEDDLSDEQLARYDAVHADATRELRAIEEKTAVRSGAADVQRETVKYLDGIYRKSQLNTLQMALRVARFARIRQTGGPRDAEEPEPSLGDVRFVVYPYPTLHRRHLERAVAACRTENGASRAAEHLARCLRCEKEEYVTFRKEQDIQFLKEVAEQLADRGHGAEVFGWALEEYERLHEAHSTDIHELRAALREYLSDPKSVLHVLRRNRRKSRRSQETGRR